jgi:hypothetical protein
MSQELNDDGFADLTEPMLAVMYLNGRGGGGVMEINKATFGMTEAQHEVLRTLIKDGWKGSLESAAQAARLLGGDADGTQA